MFLSNLYFEKIIYCISGLGADYRVYDYLNLKYELVHLNWIAPKNKETIESYAFRLSKFIDIREDFYLIGVSFGGLIATEISKIIRPKFLFLISSVHLKSELPLLYRFIGTSNII